MKQINFSPINTEDIRIKIPYYYSNKKEALERQPLFLLKPSPHLLIVVTVIFYAGEK